MRILVIDDGTEHLEAARAQLGSAHDVVLAGTYDEGRELLRGQRGFEVVLCDLLMPASGNMLGSKEGLRLVGQEMPIGIFLAILAAKNGAKYVGLLTDSDHHSHPASACLDAIQRNEGHPDAFRIEGATVVLSNCRNWIRNFDPSDLATPIAYDVAYAREKAGDSLVRAKYWPALLDRLLEGEKSAVA
ncbi:MAG: hypothetical protein Q8Q85_10890 [Gemmatimonadales bacterium]|nr:hypothetical protein [Gemmatimonadales bacterium]